MTVSIVIRSAGAPSLSLIVAALSAYRTDLFCHLAVVHRLDSWSWWPTSRGHSGGNRPIDIGSLCGCTCRAAPSTLSGPFKTYIVFNTGLGCHEAFVYRLSVFSQTRRSSVCFSVDVDVVIEACAAATVPPRARREDRHRGLQRVDPRRRCRLSDPPETTQCLLYPDSKARWRSCIRLLVQIVVVVMTHHVLGEQLLVLMSQKSKPLLFKMVLSHLVLVDAPTRSPAGTASLTRLPTRRCFPFALYR